MPEPAPVVSRLIHAERLVLLGWSRAILLQLSHPLMAAAVASHSSFRSGTVGAAMRLRHTVGAMLALTFGDDSAQTRALAGIRAIHDRVNGTLKSPVGRFPKGTPYSANDPDLLLWVHVSLLESVVLAHNAFVRPLDEVERNAYCEESAPIAVRLGARLAEVPRTWRALVDCVTAIEASGALCVGDDAKAVASAVLSPPMSAAIWPVRWLNRQFTISTLPDDLRRQYGFERNQDEIARVQRATQLVRGVRRLTPRRLAQWGASRR